MSSNVVAPSGQAIITATASQKVAVYSLGSANVFKLTPYANYPTQSVLLGTASNGVYTTAALNAGDKITIEPDNALPAMYEVGLTPVVKSSLAVYQPAPNTLNATGTITAAMVMGGILTSTTAAAVAGTLDTGAIMDTSSDWDIGDCVVWSVINTGGNTFTVTASTGHTIVGVAAVVTVTTGRFLTKKTAADTFVTYRIS